MSKTFKWTIPEVGLSRAEQEEHRSYKPANRSIHTNQATPLRKSELKFLKEWGVKRQLGRKAYYQKLLLRSCLAVSLFTGFFLLFKVLGVIDDGTTIYTTGTMLALGVNIAPAIHSWKNNEQRYEKLLERLEETKQ
ncbi:hypothetical protein DDZ13_00475 [Coraliomargarita sinensis]|uniref:DUF4231 domain-containing protein n=1 Tax=Coraliomargarita sinensis TaxID=2174842 RepID=A0A317ZIE0_9BACT|nr:hypothetical protein [Coraliomargarita sinensis]PXA05375.1 hypothetical protein DDZ13_00475 [Coraliomargarita sinensis]